MALHESNASRKPSRTWPLYCWIGAVCLCFPVVALGWAVAVAEAVYGNMEPVFIVAGTAVLSVVAALFGGITLCILLTSSRKLTWRLLVVLTIFEAGSIPTCRLIVKHGQTQRESHAA